MTKERIEKLLKAGANVVLTTKGIDDMALKVSICDFLFQMLTTLLQLLSNHVMESMACYALFYSDIDKFLGAVCCPIN